MPHIVPHKLTILVPHLICLHLVTLPWLGVAILDLDGTDTSRHTHGYASVAYIVITNEYALKKMLFFTSQIFSNMLCGENSSAAVTSNAFPAEVNSYGEV